MMSCSRWLSVFASVLAFAAAQSKAADRVIHITGPGPRATYVLEGESQQAPVVVRVGQTVQWRNDAGTNAAHTASAKLRDAQGDRLFDTQSIAVGATKDVKITQAMFAAAGGTPGGSATIEYICRLHGEAAMKSSLVVQDAAPSAPSVAGRVRRDITALTSTELNAYRDAWRSAQAKPEYAKVCGHHGCPDQWCHRDEITFLPWHREYLLRMEAAVGQPIHYWDWTSANAISGGIPSAFTDSTYTSADGNIYPNPLRSFAFNCPVPDATARSPGAASDLQSLANSVQAAYALGKYSEFNSSLDVPHGGLHVWVSGQMGGVFLAAYDPLFWAHHSNVDRQWASWQQGGGADPESGELSLPLFGFGKTIGDYLSISSLGYAYDRFDEMPRERAAPMQLVAARQDGRIDRAAAPVGVGKTFSVSSVQALANAAPANRPLVLEVSGVPVHPAESLAVYVFINQPDARPEDARPDNPHYAGYFGVFGRGRAAAGQHEPATRTQTIPLFGGKAPRLREQPSQVTLVVTGNGRAVLPAKSIPFDGASLQTTTPAPVDGVPRLAQTSKRGEEFVGISDTESFDLAYKDAVAKAQKKLGAGRADALIHAEVVLIEGERGGIAGFHKLRVTIRASLK